MVDDKAYDAAVLRYDRPATVARPFDSRCQEDFVSGKPADGRCLGGNIDHVAVFHSNGLFGQTHHVGESENPDIVVPPRVPEGHPGQREQTLALGELGGYNRDVNLRVRDRVGRSGHPLRVRGLEGRMNLNGLVCAHAVANEPFQHVAVGNYVRSVEH